jgi:signal transduction histidine kinase
VNQTTIIADGSAGSNNKSLAAGQFKLLPFFTAASLVMFLLLAGALWYFERQQGAFFQQVEQEQIGFFKQVQDGFATRQDVAARRDLLTIHEAGTVNLTRLFANALWERDFSPFVAKAAQVPVDACRAIADVKDEKDGKMKPPPAKKACFAEVGKKIASFPEFAALNAKVFDTMKKSTVFKIKVFDLRGITVYSSEHAQMGEDKLTNAGWKGAAVDGKAISELTFRDKFSAFEGVVEKRDLISSYMPVLAPGTEQIVGVFEVYSDVTPFLNQIKQTSADIKKIAADNQEKVEAGALENQEKVDASGNETLTIAMLLLLLLFGALFAIVWRAAAIIAQQTKDREQTLQQLSQSEKMASLGQMVAGVSHQLNTPLAFSLNNIQMAVMALDSLELPLRVAGTFTKLVQSTDEDKVMLNVAQARGHMTELGDPDFDVTMPREMLQDSLDGLEQMRELVENLRDFTRLDRSKTTHFNLNKGLHNVIYIAKSSFPTTIQVVEEFGELPDIECNVTQLNQVFLNLINNASQAISGPGTITVRSQAEGARIRVDVTDTGSGIPAEHLAHIWDNYYTTKPVGEGTGIGLSIVKTIVTEHGGEITVDTRTGEGSGTTFTVYLPLAVKPE